MPYIIAIVVVAILAVLFLVFRTPAEAPSVEEVNNTANLTEESFTTEIVAPPAGTPVADPTAPSPTDPARQTPDAATGIETDAAIEVSEATSAPIATGADGTFTGESSYSTGRSIHELDVTLTIENDIVVAVDTLYDGAGEPPTATLRSFNEAYEPEVLGKDIDDIQLSRVGGASWTSDAFNEAVDEIRAQL